MQKQIIIKLFTSILFLFSFEVAFSQCTWLNPIFPMHDSLKVKTITQYTLPLADSLNELPLFAEKIIRVYNNKGNEIRVKVYNNIDCNIYLSFLMEFTDKSTERYRYYLDSNQNPFLWEKFYSQKLSDSTNKLIITNYQHGIKIDSSLHSIKNPIRGSVKNRFPIPTYCNSNIPSCEYDTLKRITKSIKYICKYKGRPLCGQDNGYSASPEFISYFYYTGLATTPNSIMVKRASDSSIVSRIFFIKNEYGELAKKIQYNYDTWNFDSSIYNSHYESNNSYQMHISEYEYEYTHPKIIH